MSSKREESKHILPKIKVIGVGGGGGNAVKRMIEAGLTEVEFYVVNTDQEVLDNHRGAVPVQIGVNTTQGLGCGADAAIGRKAAEEDREKLHSLVADADAVFIVAGMAGGTGAGASPIIASLARAQGAFAVGIVAQPFDFEGQRRIEKAEQALQELRESVDSVVVVSNQRLLDEADRAMKIREAFHLSDEKLLRGLERSITEFHTSTTRSIT